MKSKYFIEFSGVQVDIELLEKNFKEYWKKQNRKLKDIKTLHIYYKVDEQKCYYVVNEIETISL